MKIELTNDEFSLVNDYLCFAAARKLGDLDEEREYLNSCSEPDKNSIARIAELESEVYELQAILNKLGRFFREQQ